MRTVRPRLGAIADTLESDRRAEPHALAATAELERWSDSLAGRGACRYPDGATRFVASALRVFADEFDDHARHGPCADCSAPPVLPVPAAVA